MKPAKGVFSHSRLQEESRLWWEQNPMAYDWHKTMVSPESTPEFFQEIDRRFLTSSPFYRGAALPFSPLIPYERLKGKKVLEIGCGFGTHVQLFCKAGADVTAIDLSRKAIETTRKRLSLAGLAADVRVMDAESLEFSDKSFDFVWSWGVVHHSANPQRIFDEVHRVLRSPGEFRLMVYNRHSLNALVNLARGTVSGKLLKGASPEEILSYYSDGYVARYYAARDLERMLLASGFRAVTFRVLGQKSELVPLPAKGPLRKVKGLLIAGIPDTVAKLVLGKLGGFLFATAVKSSEQAIS